VTEHTATPPAPPAQYGERIRSVRVEDELWEAAKAKANAEGRTASDVVRAALRRYVARGAK